MRKITCGCILLLLIFVATAQERNFVIWNLNKVEVHVNDKITLAANEKIHFLPKSGNLSLKLSELSLKREILPWFQIGMAGRVLWIRQESGWLQEYRPMIFSNLSTGLNRWNLEFSNRMDYRIYKVLKSHFRHRQMLTLEVPPFQESPWFKIYLAEEGYYLFEEEHFHLFRLHTGTKFIYSNTFEMKLYYILEKSRKSNFWNTSDILGLNLQLGF